MPKKIGQAWITESSIDEMIAEAEHRFPYESGGALLGYWAKQYEEVVITDVIGPGPGATHRAQSFLPDSEYQEKEIACRYEESGRLHTYLGDWHTHPRSIPYLSRKDRRTLKTIAKHRDARASAPLMAILWWPSWALEIWMAKPIQIGRVKFMFQIPQLHVRIYS